MKKLMAHNLSSRILLLNPPVVKPSEPPAGLARLAGALHQHGLHCTIVDLNLEGLFHLLHTPRMADDRWTQRALRSLPKNLRAIRDSALYRHVDRYRRAVMDLNRVLETSSPNPKVHLSLANYQHDELSPVRSRDLLRAAEVPEENPFFPYFQERLESTIAHENPTVTGVSLNYLSQALCTFALLGWLRRTCPDVTLVLGGGLVTSWLRNPTWRNPFIGLVDHLVAGAGESALLDIVGTHNIEHQHFMPHYDFAPIPLATHHSSPTTQPASLSTQHPAPFTLHSSLFTLHSPYLTPGFVLPYSASTGCYWNRCAFCPERAEGSPYVPIPVNRVVTELQHLVRTTDPVLVHFLDNTLSPRLLKALVDRPPGVPWYGFARITEHFVSRDFCTALKRSGCIMLQVGIESGDQQVLDQECKGIELEVVSRALENLKTAGIATYVYLLFGTPPESLLEARKTLAFTVKHAEEIAFLNLAIFNLPIYGPEARELNTRLHYEGDLSLYVDFDHPRGWHRVRVRQFLDKEFKRHPAVASIIRRDPPFFTSNHAPFLISGGADPAF